MTSVIGLLLLTQNELMNTDFKKISVLIYNMQSIDRYNKIGWGGQI